MPVAEIVALITALAPTGVDLAKIIAGLLNNTPVSAADWQAAYASADTDLAASEAHLATAIAGMQAAKGA